MLQFDDEDLSDIGGYDLVHHDDLAYVASAHQECKPYSLQNCYCPFTALLFICRTLMPCRLTSPQTFCAGPNFLCQTKR